MLQLNQWGLSKPSCQRVKPVNDCQRVKPVNMVGKYIGKYILVWVYTSLYQFIRWPLDWTCPSTSYRLVYQSEYILVWVTWYTRIYQYILTQFWYASTLPIIPVKFVTVVLLTESPSVDVRHATAGRPLFFKFGVGVVRLTVDVKVLLTESPRVNQRQGTGQAKGRCVLQCKISLCFISTGTLVQQSYKECNFVSCPTASALLRSFVWREQSSTYGRRTARPTRVRP
jgi:hypothetical protein